MVRATGIEGPDLPQSGAMDVRRLRSYFIPTGPMHIHTAGPIGLLRINAKAVSIL